jgi:hypothetical protein
MKLYILCFSLLCQIFALCGISPAWRNQFTVTGIRYLQQQTEQGILLGLWQPELDLNQNITKSYLLTSQAVGTFQAAQTFNSGDDRFKFTAKAYRLWLKAGTNQTSVRFGLQRLNFGSAQILRPLQWFDNLDPRDKLEQTEGVQAILTQQYYLNNANFWLWGIRGEGKIRGQSLTVTKKETPELGGRIQFPLSNGDIAFTINHREDTKTSILNTGAESKAGFDARLNFGFGLWCEGYVSRFEQQTLVPRFQAPLTIGYDNTIPIGNGIYVLLEAEQFSEADTLIGNLHSGYRAFAFTANYPIGILDTILYYGIVKDDNSSSVHSFIWRRTYDHLSWDAGLFWDAGTKHKFYGSRGAKVQISYTF